MKTIRMYQVDAFTDRQFGGNPAAVCVLDEWLPESVMQLIGMENNLSETAFVVNENGDYSIRWFTPTCEVSLCGHATLASSFVLFNYFDKESDSLKFSTRERGCIFVSRQDGRIVLDFPADIPVECNCPDGMAESLGIKPDLCLKGRTDYMLVYKNEQDISSMNPDFSSLKKVNARGVIVTAPGKNADFVSRFFAPQSGIDEDPVTGSAHTMLIPYWSGILNKNELNAMQISKRTGVLYCAYQGDRVKIGGSARLYLIGDIFVEEN